jgi:imidazolonepropionase-like amidohydrolase
VLTIFKSDSSDIVQRMYTEAAKGVKYGLTEDEALATITLNPAKILGIDQWVGSIEKGKQADIAVFSRSPLDIYTRVDMTFIDGRQVFDRATDEATVTHKEFAR